MKRKGMKERIISDIGKDFFKRDVFTLSFDEKKMFSDYAVKCKYRKPKNSYLSRGSAFYVHLQKIANK